MIRYRTRDGDMIDAICHVHYGHTDGAVEAVLEANRHLTRRDPVLPAGLIIDLPDLPSPAARPDPVRLWD